MTYICYRGIEVSARLQYFLLGFEVIVLIVLSIYALIKVYTRQRPCRTRCTRRCPGSGRAASTSATSSRRPS